MEIFFLEFSDKLEGFTMNEIPSLCYVKADFFHLLKYVCSPKDNWIMLKGVVNLLGSFVFVEGLVLLEKLVFDLESVLSDYDLSARK